MRAMPKIPYAAEDTLLASVFGMYSSGILLFTLLFWSLQQTSKIRHRIGII